MTLAHTMQVYFWMSQLNSFTRVMQLISLCSNPELGNSPGGGGLGAETGADAGPLAAAPVLSGLKSLKAMPAAFQAGPAM